MIENSNKIENKINEEKNNDNIQIEENKEKKIQQIMKKRKKINY